VSGLRVGSEKLLQAADVTVNALDKEVDALVKEVDALVKDAFVKLVEALVKVNDTRRVARVIESRRLKGGCEDIEGGMSGGIERKECRKEKKSSEYRLIHFFFITSVLLVKSRIFFLVKCNSSFHS